MNRRARMAPLAALAAALLPAAAAALASSDAPGSPYIVVLVDGTQLRAQGPPRIAGDEAWIVHAASGVAFAVPAARVDLEVSRRLNRMIAARAIPAPRPPAVSGGGAAGSTPPALPAAPPRTRTVAEEARAEAWSGRLAALQGEQARLEEERSALEERRREVEREIRRYLGVPRMVSALGAELKKVRRAQEENERRRGEVAAALADLFQAAAESGIPLRQRP